MKNEISNDEHTWFYIGYTGKLGNYLWTITWKSRKAHEIIESSKLVKSHTYYTHLKDKAKETEYNLIKKFIKPERCLNAPFRQHTAFVTPTKF